MNLVTRPTSHKKIFKPTIFNLSNLEDKKKLKKLINSRKINTIIDETAEQQRELHFVNRPLDLNDLELRKKKFSKISQENGRWIYFPWNYQLVHVLSPGDYKKLRLSRNKNLITENEQTQYEKAHIVFAGLNVGNPAALAIALEGGSINMKFADNDELSVSNLNRFRAGIGDLGINKAILTARQVYEINPFAKVKVLENGLNEKNIQSFILKPKADVIVEEMDHLPLKIHIRKLAKKYKIPVVMVTGNAENVILDVERYDLDPKLKILNGKLSPHVQSKVKSIHEIKSINEFALLCRDFIGKELLTDRLLESFDEVGKSLAGIPQLAEASFLRGYVLSYTVRQLVLKERVQSGRYTISLKNILL